MISGSTHKVDHVLIKWDSLIHYTVLTTKLGLKVKGYLIAEDATDVCTASEEYLLELSTIYGKELQQWCQELMFPKR